MGLPSVLRRLPSWLTALVWLPALGLPLLSDDLELFWAVRDGGAAGVWFAAPSPFFRPGMGLFWLLQDAAFGDAAWPRHLLSVLLHVGCTVGVGRLAERLAPGRGVAAGALFGCLACHGEATAWVAAQGDLLATLFGLVYLLWGLEGRRWAAAWLLAALACKESALGLPLVLACLRGRPGWDLLFVPAWLALRATMLEAWVAGYGAGAHAPTDPLRYVASVATMAIRSLVPPFLPHPGTLVEWSLVLAGGGGALGLYLRVWRFGSEEVRLALGWFCAALPVLALGVRLDRFESERFLYLPSVLVCVVVARRVKVGPLVALQLVGVAFSLAAWFQSAEQVARVRAWAAGQTSVPTVVLLPDGVAGTYSLRNGFPGLWRSVHPDRPVWFEVPARIGSPRFGVPVTALPVESGWTFVSAPSWITGANAASEGWYWDGEAMRRLGDERP